MAGTMSTVDALHKGLDELINQSEDLLDLFRNKIQEKDYEIEDGVEI
jgi:hypothetical protein